MKALSIYEMTSALGLCADIFTYPSEEYSKKVRYLGELVGSEKLRDFSLPIEEMQSEYIKYFSLYTSSYKTVPFASWWIDGKMMGKSFVGIGDFYKECGFVVDDISIKVPHDHISLMFSFVSILLEDRKFFEAEKFIDNYMQWLSKFENSLKKSSKLKLFYETVCISRDLISTFKILIKNL